MAHLATGQEISNVSASSSSFDGIKLGGIRLDLDVICGVNNSRCKTNENGDLTTDINGNYIFKGDDSYQSLQAVLEAPAFASKLYGTTGGQQGLGGLFSGDPYQVGSVRDKIVEYFAGIHDRNGQALFYDSQGNTKRNRTEHEIAVTDTVAAVAVAYVAPVVMFQALPIETLKMIFGNR
ncbi:hypothetical protein [uncultured Actinobacillus sp.]|uniref:hypothetical protein n=1 Tax=uncultured Actinobacillus sp. TaxID=417616 RepID=UPI0025E0F54A|nr:hypothetical protein [uncultured Actinobacillus sp.]